MRQNSNLQKVNSRHRRFEIPSTFPNYASSIHVDSNSVLSTYNIYLEGPVYSCSKWPLLQLTSYIGSDAAYVVGLRQLYRNIFENNGQMKE